MTREPLISGPSGPGPRPSPGPRWRAGLLWGSMIALGLAVACSIPTDVEFKEVLAVIDSGDRDLPELSVPGSVEQGETFTVSFNTYFGGCEEPGRTDSGVDGKRADIFPYTNARILIEHEVCPDRLGIKPREVRLRFTEPGEATVVLHGMRLRVRDTTVVEVAATVDVTSR